MYEFNIRLADLTVKIISKYDYTYKMCKDYLTDETDADIIASSTDEDIKKEVSNVENVSEPYAESLCIYRSIARQIPAYSRAVFHGASITYKGRGLLFTAPSGTGKTTHITQWRKYLGKDVAVVNGDKPILHAENGKVTVYGTPWAGKEQWQHNTSAVLEAVCLLSQGKDNSVKRLSNDECIVAFMHQIYLPDVPNALQTTLGILGNIIESVPVYSLSCDISEEAVKASFEAMLGEKYKSKSDL